MKRYQGFKVGQWREIYAIDEDGSRRELQPIMRHSVSQMRFAIGWGFMGNATLNAALTILDDLLGRERAEQMYVRFAFDVLQHQPSLRFDLPESLIYDWLEEKEKAA